MLLLSYFVPITLLVQLEVSRWCQASFLSADERMKASSRSSNSGVLGASRSGGASGEEGGSGSSSNSSKGGAAAQSVALMDELGSVTHVFSDKTGTLTQNLMQFRCLGIEHEVYGYEEFEEEVLNPSPKALNHKLCILDKIHFAGNAVQVAKNLKARSKQ